MNGWGTLDHFTVLLGEKSFKQNTDCHATDAALGVWKTVLSPVLQSERSAARTDYSWIQSLTLATSQDVQCGYNI